MDASRIGGGLVEMNEFHQHEQETSRSLYSLVIDDRRKQNHTQKFNHFTHTFPALPFTDCTEQKECTSFQDVSV